MTRHIIDKRAPANSNLRTLAFLKIDRDSKPQSASRALQERPKLDDSTGRLKEFLRIERGRQV